MMLTLVVTEGFGRLGGRQQKVPQVGWHSSLGPLEQPLPPCFVPESQQLWWQSIFSEKVCEQDMVCKFL